MVKNPMLFKNPPREALAAELLVDVADDTVDVADAASAASVAKVPLALSGAVPLGAAPDAPEGAALPPGPAVPFMLPPVLAVPFILPPVPAVPLVLPPAPEGGLPDPPPMPEFELATPPVS